MAGSEEIVIVGAARTAVGSFGGAFGAVPAHELGATAIKAALERANVSPEDVDEVLFGQVLTAGAGQNQARQAAIQAGIPEEATAWGLHQVCDRKSTRPNSRHALTSYAVCGLKKKKKV